jgi:signal transduction histidine kinase
VIFRRPGYKLRTKIIAWSFVPTAIILLLVALTNYFAYQQVTQEVVLSRDKELVRLAASEVSASFEEYIDRLYTLARMPKISQGNAQAQQEAIFDFKNQLVLFDGGVYILDNLGKVVAGQPEKPELIGQDWSDRSFFQSMVRGPSLFFSNALSEGPADEKVITIAAPILGDNEEFRGVVAGMFYLDVSAVSPFYGTLIKLRIGRDGTAFLLDANNQVIFSSDADQIGKSFPAQPVLSEANLGQVGAVRTRNPENRDVVAGFSPVPRTPWTLIVEQDWAELVRSSQGYRQFLIILLVLGVLVPTVVVMFGVRRITGPISEFTAAAQRIASGDFSTPIKVRTGDELENLAIQFNHMAQQLHESYETLELRVALRTQELTALNSLAAVVSQSLDLNQILPDALEKTLEVMGMEAGAVFRLDEETETLLLVAQKNLSDELIQLSENLPLDLSIVREVTELHRPISRYISDYAPGPVKTILIKDGWTTVVSIPLMAQEKVLGAINALSQTKVQLSPEKLAVPASIGQQIGVAMDNARLFNQTLEYARQMEAARQAAEEARYAAEKANSAKSDFLANVSHELRTPLVSIFGFARIVQRRLRERIIPLLPQNDLKSARVVEQVEDNLQIILTEGQRLTALINNLLDLEKIESGKMEWHMQSINLGDVIESALAATASLIDESRRELSVDIPEHLPPVYGEKDKLIQVMINLISNAIKFSQKGKIGVQARQVNAEIIVSVSDEGVGISPTDQERVFEKFIQVGDTLTGKPMGTGLGLAICREILEHHGGRIWVESNLGKGSTFSFSLPVYIGEYVSI